jgi:hypothetical protein
MEADLTDQVWSLKELVGLLEQETATGYVMIKRTRIMYIESKAEGLNGPARIGRVTFNKTGRTLYYKGQSFQSLKGHGFKANYRGNETGEEYWISGPRRDGLDRLYGKSALVVEIDDDVREEYWTEIRKKPGLILRRTT